MSAPRYAAVVLPVPVSRPYIYEVPAALADRVVPGARVVVPLRRRSVVGIVTALDVAAPPAGVGIRPLAAAPDAEPALSPALLELCRWISDYYGAPLGLALRAFVRDPLDRSLKDGKGSNWIRRPPAPVDPARYEQQF
jgi:primosomal protein N' (replication factor Y)